MRKLVKLLDKYLLNRWRPGFHEKLIAPYLPDEPIIVEAGAHTGIDTIAMANLWKKGIIHAFEPVPELYTKLVKNTRLLSNVYTYPYALGASAGQQKMYISSGRSDASSSLLKPKKHLAIHPDVLFREEFDVEVLTLDNWVYKYNISSIDFFWLDLQGIELEVLKHSLSLLPNVRAIYLEVNLLENYKGCCLFDELKDWLGKNNFRLVSIDVPWADGGNALFVSTSNFENK